MRIRSLTRILITLSILVLGMGVAICSYFRFISFDKQEDFDLYKLVPADASAVFETERMGDLLDGLDYLHYETKETGTLDFSDILKGLKRFREPILKNAPHGLSRLMNKVLISFHEPDTPDSQVLYCALSLEDYERLKVMIPPFTICDQDYKENKYRGESLRIYPISNGRFLTFFCTKEFLVLSYHKRLVEHVIDAWKDKETLHYDKTIKKEPLKRNLHPIMSSLFIRFNEEMGGWTEFDLKLDAGAIYCSGIKHLTDSIYPKLYPMVRADSLDVFPGAVLPKTTYFYDQWSFNESKLLEGGISSLFSDRQWSVVTKHKVLTILSEFLRDYAKNSAVSCLFQSQDSTLTEPRALVSIPLLENKNGMKELQKYRLALKNAGLFITCYNNYLLIASNEGSLKEYLSEIQQNHTIEGVPFYDDAVASLAVNYQALMMADLDKLEYLPIEYSSLLPPFFMHHISFFRDFKLAIQLTMNTETNVLHPNIVLLYEKIPEIIEGTMVVSEE